MRHTRMTFDLKAALAKSDYDLCCELKNNDGTPFDAEKARREIAGAYGQGYDVMPVCDCPDIRGYCACDETVEICECGWDCFPRHASGCGGCGTKLVRREATP